MMPWFRLILVCWTLLALFLGLTPPAGWNYQEVVSSGPLFDHAKETVSDLTSTSVVESMEFDPARTASLESLVLGRALTASSTGPPGQQTRASATDGALGELPVKPATQTNPIEQPSPRNYWLSTAELRNRGSATGFS